MLRILVRMGAEIYRYGYTPMDLTGFAAGDGTNPLGRSTGEGMGLFPDGTMISAGQVMVIAANANGLGRHQRIELAVAWPQQ